MVLVVTEVEEYAVLDDRTAERPANLALLFVGLAADVGRLRVARAIAHIEKAGAMPTIAAAGVRDHIEHRSTRAS